MALYHILISLQNWASVWNLAFLPLIWTLFHLTAALLKKWSKHSKVLGVYFGYMWGKIPWADWAQIFLEEDIPDIIMCFKFGDDRLRGLVSAEGQILPLPIDFDGRPYNTLTLPCDLYDAVFSHDQWSKYSTVYEGAVKYGVYNSTTAHDSLQVTHSPYFVFTKWWRQCLHAVYYRWFTHVTVLCCDVKCLPWIHNSLIGLYVSAWVLTVIHDFIAELVSKNCYYHRQLCCKHVLLCMSACVSLCLSVKSCSWNSTRLSTLLLRCKLQQANFFTSSASNGER